MDIPIEKVIEAGGGCVSLARKLMISKGAVSQWEKIPVGRVLEVSAITGYAPHELRSDIYPAPKIQEAA
ncbi:MAG: Cro/CI family transcriptional regulator [Gallionellaceae bacterium]